MQNSWEILVIEFVFGIFKLFIFNSFNDIFSNIWQIFYNTHFKEEV